MEKMLTNPYQFFDIHSVHSWFLVGIIAALIVALLVILYKVLTKASITKDKNGNWTYKWSNEKSEKVIQEVLQQNFITEKWNADSKAEKLLSIFEAYNCCDASEIGQLVRQEMLVCLGRQNGIDWDCIVPNGLEHAKKRYKAVHDMVKEQWFEDHPYRKAFEQQSH